jgi:hypothetical protein
LTAKTNDPFLVHALICEEIIMDQRTNTPSYIKVLDHVGVRGQGEEYEPTQIKFYIASTFRSDESAAPANYVVRVIGPSKKHTELSTGSILFQPGKSAAIFIECKLLPKSAGQHWIEILLNAKRVARLPLQIEYQQLPSESVSKKPGKAKELRTKN